jgi:hypothetical protein
VRARALHVGRCWLGALTVTLSSACSMLLDLSEQQCASDWQCQARGLNDSVCIDNLCQQPADGAAGQGSTMRPDGTAGTAGTAATAGTGSVAPRPDDSARAGAGGLAEGPITAGRGDDTPGMADAGVMTGNAGSSGANAGAGGMSEPSGEDPSCDGASCPECRVSADCEQLGNGNGSCIEGKCWEQAPQCEVDADCAELGPEYAGGRCQERRCFPNPRWRCEPVPPRAPDEMLELTLPVIDALRLELVPEVPLTACGKLDYTCERPFTTTVTMQDGRARLKLPGNFAGYIQQNERKDYAPGLYFMPVRLPADNVLSNFPVISTPAIAGLAFSLGTTADPARGHIMLVVEDCKGAAVAGVKFTSPQADDRAVQFYVRDQIPTTSAKDTPPEGTAGFVNFPAGVAEITATHLESGVKLATVSVLIRAGAIAMSYVRPETRGTTVTGREAGE